MSLLILAIGIYFLGIVSYLLAKKLLSGYFDSDTFSAPLAVDKYLPIKTNEFRAMMNAVTDFAASYLGNPKKYTVTCEQSPGFLYRVLPREMPLVGEAFKDVLNDLERQIMPGVAQWLHPRFHAYYPTGCSFPDMISEVIVGSMGIVQFSWDAAPAFTELEITMVNWFGRAIGLPDDYLYIGNSEASTGGGSIQTTASSAILNVLLSARRKKIRSMVPEDSLCPHEDEMNALTLLCCYASQEAHSCIEKAARLAMVRFRSVPTDDQFAMRGDALEREIMKDMKKGLVPFFVHGTIGTTAIASFDNLEEITKVAATYAMWVHVDGAYAGNALICPEFRQLMEGIYKVDSLNVNMHKMMLTSNTCTVLWTKKQAVIRDTFSINPVYLKRNFEAATDFRNWGVDLSRRTRCLNMWFLFRLYGLNNLQKYVRRVVSLAQRFKNHLDKDDRIEVVGGTHLSLVCFRVKNEDPELANKLTADLCQFINRSHKMMVTHAAPKKMDIVRFIIGQERYQESDVDEDWRVLNQLLTEFFALEEPFTASRSHLYNAAMPLSPSSSQVTTLDEHTDDEETRDVDTAPDIDEDSILDEHTADEETRDVDTAPDIDEDHT